MSKKKYRKKTTRSIQIRNVDEFRASHRSPVGANRKAESAYLRPLTFAWPQIDVG